MTRPLAARFRVCVLLALAALAVACRAERLTVLYTGETHAMISPCDCTVSQDGGVARRATALREIRRGGLTPTLLVDAGGQFGGSAYDEYTQGPEVDKERTRTHLRACASMGYDAYAISDEELQWGLDFLRQAGELGGAPFLSANMDPTALEAVGGRRFVVKEVGGLRIGVTAMTNRERYALPSPFLPDEVALGDPVEGARAALREMAGQVDLTVVLSSLGTDETRAAAGELAEADIVINSHRRAPGSLIGRVGDALVCEFNLEARALSRLDLDVRDGVITEYRLREIALDPSVPDDPDMAALVADFEARVPSIGGPSVVMDLYTAWGCGYCADAEPEIQNALAAFGPDRVELRRWHFVHQRPETGELMSGFGPESLDEAKREVAVERLHGSAALSRYAMLRLQDPRGKAETALTACGMDPAEVEALARSDAVTAALTHHATRSERFGIPGTPFIYLNNRPLDYAGAVSTPALLRGLCWSLAEDARTGPCAGVPECASDGDCRETGKIGRCVNGRCEYSDPPPLEVRVLTSPELMLTSPRGLLASLREIFPGLTSTDVTYDSAEGQTLASLGEVRWLPAVFIPREQFLARPNHQPYLDVLEPVTDYYKVPALPQWTGIGGFDVTREPVEGKLDVFYQALNLSALESVGSLLSIVQTSDAASRVTLDLHPLVFLSQEGGVAAEGGVAEIEEAARQTVVWRDHPEAMAPYLAFRQAASNSSYWDVPLTMAGLDPEEIRHAATLEPAAMQSLYETAMLVEELNTWGEAFLLYENREVVDMASPEKVREVADRLGVAASSVTVLFTGGTNGQLEACRCPGNPYGGLTRQAGAIAELREIHPRSVLLDAGDMLSDERDWKKLTYLQRAFALLDYDAVAIGDQDFAYGAEVLASAAQSGVAPYVSANVKSPGLDPDVRVIEASGARIGVLSVTSPRCFAFREGGVPEGVEIEDPVAAAKRVLPDLAANSDVVVALYHGPLDDARSFAAEIEGLAAVICAHEGVSMQVPEMVGGAVLCAPGRNGEWLGRLTLRFDVPGEEPAVDYALIPMDDAILEDPAMATLIAEYQAEVQGELAAALRAAGDDPDSTAEACMACHPDEHAQWLTTTHATADVTLRDLDREFDPNCWDCHSAAALKEGAARLPAVTCVACHRVGPATATGHEILEPLTVDACLPCHTEGKSPEFTEERYWPAVVH